MGDKKVRLKKSFSYNNVFIKNVYNIFFQDLNKFAKNTWQKMYTIFKLQFGSL